MAGWSNEELEASVNSYFRMQSMNFAGKAYVKIDEYR